ncbi:uncharacterized protein LOC120698439 isoform X16 [Panicum virgatum]|uniref:uncharacterized protein LOC120698439 isoform X16 n=1 Tax=Panicum virgatum TaxID=38727 RepID=UPI0019D52B6B|nr:uncharacterized protein LOC120698439 isoform X16 [Panicum virgatum]
MHCERQGGHGHQPQHALFLQTERGYCLLFSTNGHLESLGDIMIRGNFKLLRNSVGYICSMPLLVDALHTLSELWHQDLKRSGHVPIYFDCWD